MKAVVAIDANSGIGYQGQLLCRLRADLRHFKEITTGHTVILGRKTLATFPGGAPLPERRNIILSRNPDFTVEGAQVVHSVEEALAIAPEDSFVIGGQSIYEDFLPYCDEVCATRIYAAFPADAWFPELLEKDGWRVSQEEPVMEEKGVRFQFITYTRDGEAPR